ncbi:MAG: hypothetical protein ACD_75C01492G0003 [uncultured bacterium]|nr:MAG: hypothetical protein ACD_75C01492G0003 [uncultured bacterium]
MALGLEDFDGLGEVVVLPDGFRLLSGHLVVAADRMGNFREIADPLGRNDNRFGRRHFLRRFGQRGMQCQFALFAEFFDDAVVERGDPVVVEFGGDGPVHREVLRRGIPQLAVALDLLADIADGVVAAFFLEFIDDDDVGIIEHVDFLQLGGGAVFAGHDIDRNIGDLGDFRIPLADAGGLGNDQIKSGCLRHQDRFRQSFGDLAGRIAGGETPHIDPIGIAQRIHADAVAEQGPAGLFPRWVTADDGNMNVFDIIEKTNDDLVGQR